MNEYYKWKKTENVAFRITNYFKDKQERQEKKLKLADVLRDLNDLEFETVKGNLLRIGYEIKLDYSNFDATDKIRIGRNNYSFFTMTPTKMRQEWEQQKETIQQLQKKLTELQQEEKSNKLIVEQLEKKKTNERCAGRKPLPADTVKQIFDFYLQGLSLREIGAKIGKVATAVKYTLENPIYLQLGYITEEEFQNAKAALIERRKNKN